MLGWSKTAARMPVGQGMNGETDMKRIILAALVGVLVSGPAVAAEDASVLLHCSGWQEDTEGGRHGDAINMRIARDGGWIIWNGTKRNRTEEKKDSSPTWYYVFQWGVKLNMRGDNIFKTKKGNLIQFSPKSMTLYYDGFFGNKWLACFPITNPLNFSDDG